jgi:hypothetical protein
MSKSSGDRCALEAEWLDRKIIEAQNDPVGLWQLVKAGRERFGFDGIDLEQFIHRCIISLMETGAFPVSGDVSVPSGWHRQHRYGADPPAIAAAIIREWKRAGRDPDFGDVWFATATAL